MTFINCWRGPWNKKNGGQKYEDQPGKRSGGKILIATPSLNCREVIKVCQEHSHWWIVFCYDPSQNVSFGSAASQNSVVTQQKRQRSLEQNLTAQGEVLPSEGFLWLTKTPQLRMENQYGVKKSIKGCTRSWYSIKRNWAVRLSVFISKLLSWEPPISSEHSVLAESLFRRKLLKFHWNLDIINSYLV